MQCLPGEGVADNMSQVPLVEIAAILSNDDHNNTMKEAYFGHIMTIFSAKYVVDNKTSLDDGRLSYVSLYTLSNLTIRLKSKRTLMAP